MHHPLGSPSHRPPRHPLLPSAAPPPSNVHGPSPPPSPPRTPPPQPPPCPHRLYIDAHVPSLPSADAIPICIFPSPPLGATSPFPGTMLGYAPSPRVSDARDDVRRRSRRPIAPLQPVARHPKLHNMRHPSSSSRHGLWPFLQTQSTCLPPQSHPW